MTLAGSGVAGQDETLFAAHEVEGGELCDLGLVDTGLKVEVERMLRVTYFRLWAAPRYVKCCEGTGGARAIGALALNITSERFQPGERVRLGPCGARVGRPGGAQAFSAACFISKSIWT